MDKKEKLWMSVILASGIALSGLCGGYFYYLSKTKTNFVTVKGLAELNVKADLGIWNLKYTVLGNDLSVAQNKMEKQQKLIVSFLQNKGFSSQEISIKRTETNDIKANPYRSDNSSSERYILTQNIQVTSSNVDLLDTTINSTGELIAKGILFNDDYTPVSYLFTKINEVKPQMLKQATENAKLAAEEFAKSSGSSVGKIHKANQGVFSILPRYQTYNANEMNSIEKKVRVVSTIEYFLE